MIDLKRYSGLPLKLKGCKLVFGKGVKKVRPVARTLSEATDFYIERASRPKELYYMYRGVCMERDEKVFEKNGLRYDVTVLRCGKIGREHIKTIGHYHAECRKGLTYPELYEVLHGKALFLLQNENEVIAIKAKNGDKIFIPPNYGHTTINMGTTPLVVANLEERTFKPCYDIFRQHKGAMYYEVDGRLVKNRHYEKVPKLKTGSTEKRFGKEPLYVLATKQPRLFEFLKNPD